MAVDSIIITLISTYESILSRHTLVIKRSSKMMVSQIVQLTQKKNPEDRQNLFPPYLSQKMV